MTATVNTLTPCSIPKPEYDSPPVYDPDAIHTYVYPSKFFTLPKATQLTPVRAANYPERKYQFAIVKRALSYNTLVCLPTGLGKTFIAAVVMYNFKRYNAHSSTYDQHTL